MISVNNLKDILRDFKSRIIDKKMFDLFKAEIDDSIKNLSFKNLSDVSKNLKTNTFVAINKDGEIEFKDDISDKETIKQIIDKDSTKFSNINSLKFSNLKGVVDQDNNELSLSLDKIFSTDLSDMPSVYEDNKVLVSNKNKMKYELLDMRELFNSKENYSTTITEDEWGLNDELDGKYTKVINHDRNSMVLIVAVYDANNMNITNNFNYQLLDNDNLMLITSSPINCRIIINCSGIAIGGGSSSGGTGSAIISADMFIDDNRIRDDKAYSSKGITNILQNEYVKKNDVYTKSQCDNTFALKSTEHTHANYNTLLKLSEDTQGNILFNDKILLTELKASIYQKQLTEETHNDLDLIIDVNSIFSGNNYQAIISSEFTIRNNIINNEDTNNIEENQLHLVITDLDLTILDVYIKPSETQQYVLGISPNIKIYVKLPNGTISANYYMTNY